MSDSRRDQDRRMGFDPVGMSIELDRRVLVALEDHVNFGLHLVVVLSGLAADLG